MDFVKTGLEQYISRIKRYSKFEWQEIPDVKNGAKLSKVELKVAEGEFFLKQIKQTDFVVILDEKGKPKSSIEFAEMLQHHFNYNRQDLILLIGGAYGFSEEIYDRADQKLSLSNMTFSHQIIRVILCEQVYRAFTIIRGEPYHHA